LGNSKAAWRVRRARAASARKILPGFFFSASNPDGDDESEHNVTAADVRRFEQAVGKRTSWVYFSDNWCESVLFRPPCVAGLVR
jgi:hypothetical protein